LCEKRITFNSVVHVRIGLCLCFLETQTRKLENGEANGYA